MVWKNSWFQVCVCAAVISGALLIYDFGPQFIHLPSSSSDSPVQEASTSDQDGRLKDNLLKEASIVVQAQQATPDDKINEIIQQGHLNDVEYLKKLDPAATKNMVMDTTKSIFHVVASDPVAAQVARELIKQGIVKLPPSTSIDQVIPTSASPTPTQSELPPPALAASLSPETARLLELAKHFAEMQQRQPDPGIASIIQDYQLDHPEELQKLDSTTAQDVMSKTAIRLYRLSASNDATASDLMKVCGIGFKPATP